MASFHERFGNPFSGKDLDRLTAFLKEQDLDYDRNIEHTMILEEEDRIIATASCHGNVLKCVAVSPDYQGHNLMGQLMTHMVEHFFEQGKTHYFGFTKPKNKDIFCSLGLYPVAQTENILLLENRKNGLKKYVEKLKKERDRALHEIKENPNGEGIGAIIANCNPFTLGHRYLMEEASRQCRFLHVFILSEEQSFISTKERYELVKAGTEGLTNIILHKTSDYLISPAVFPTYFIKDKASAYEMNCMLDLEIFTKDIAPALGINKRFAGTEPNCQVTNAYNECMRKELPLNSIEFIEIPRKEIGGRPVSASYVREAYKQGKLDEVKEYLPQSSYQLLLNKRGLIC